MEHKGYLIKLDKATTSYTIHHTGKGSLPNALQGNWTSTKLAIRAIDTYLNSQPK